MWPSDLRFANKETHSYWRDYREECEAAQQRVTPHWGRATLCQAPSAEVSELNAHLISAMGKSV
jgi:hypothetical protein